MNENEKMESVVKRLSLKLNHTRAKSAFWVDFHSEFTVLFQLKSICDLGKSFVLDIAFFKN